MSKLYTSAQIDKHTLFWLFGVEFGMIDCSINSLEQLEKEVDTHYTKEEILSLITPIEDEV